VVKAAEEFEAERGLYNIMSVLNDLQASLRYSWRRLSKLGAIKCCKHLSIIRTQTLQSTPLAHHLPSFTHQKPRNQPPHPQISPVPPVIKLLSFFRIPTTSNPQSLPDCQPPLKTPSPRTFSQVSNSEIALCHSSLTDERLDAKDVANGAERGVSVVRRRFLLCCGM
jgi:hypothetical protein